MNYNNVNNISKFVTIPVVVVVAIEVATFSFINNCTVHRNVVFVIDVFLWGQTFCLYGCNRALLNVYWPS